jgi:enoyl-CoA hydratase/carnithine racemase
VLVEVEVQGRVAVVTLSRPEARNAISPEMAAALAAALDRLEEDPDLWVGVLAAEGQAFSVGADLKAGDATEVTGPPPRAGTLNPIFTRPRRKPLVAAVDGVAAGGGFELVLDCDLVVASPAARFLLPEVRWSLVAAAGGAIRLHQYLPRNVAMDLLLTGRPLTCEEAFRWGLVNRLAEPGEARTVAVGFAEELCQAGPVAVRETRRVLLAASRPDEAAHWAALDEALAAATGAADFQEGIRSFLEKRPARWTGA